MNESDKREDLIGTTVEAFWRTIPPLWHYTRGTAHQIAQEEYGITFSQFHVLRRIWHGRSSVSELSECMHVSKPNISRAVEELVSAGLAQRTRDPNDRRVQYLSLTEEGRILLVNLHEKNHAFTQGLFTDLTDEELKVLISTFNKMDQYLLESDRAHHK